MSSSLLAAIVAEVEGQGGGQGLFPTAIEGVSIVRSFQEMMPARRLYRPSLCVVVQGAKEILFGGEIMGYGAMECLVVSMELPASGRIVKASADEPYIGITIDFDVAMIREVIEQLDALPASEPDPGPCLFVASIDAPLADCILRLLKMGDQPRSIPVLYPAVMREICCWLLMSERGGELRKLALPETQTQRVSNAIVVLRRDFKETLRIDDLAETARMSASSFHQHFKALTSMTPLQFQKQLRLLEARRLMVSNAANVTEAAYEVGYESASQFSREYARTFGAAPKQDVMAQQHLFRTYASRERPQARAV